MAETPWDVIIVGQGLAGTTLAWRLHDAGRRVLMIDAGEPVTSSKIAAGLITPITGKRMALSWRCDEFLATARSFYDSIEQRTGRRLFHDRIALRLFKSDEERQQWSRRAGQPAYQAHVMNPQPEPLLDPALGNAAAGGFAMRAAQLDVTAYLEVSREHLAFEPMTLDWRRDVVLNPDGVSIQGHKTRMLISCEGYAATRNPYFLCVPFIAAKGDILTVRFHRPVPPRCLHRGIWLAPAMFAEMEPDVFWVGSTYDWENLDQTPCASARSEIEGRLKAFLHVPYTVLDHRAAVRPIIKESRALIGRHPHHKQLGYFNGLGSKGSLHAPWYAQQLTQHLVHGIALPADLDVGQCF